jgi:hypothetical protein
MQPKKSRIFARASFLGSGLAFGGHLQSDRD